MAGQWLRTDLTNSLIVFKMWTQGSLTWLKVSMDYQNIVVKNNTHGSVWCCLHLVWANDCCENNVKLKVLITISKILEGDLVFESGAAWIRHLQWVTCRLTLPTMCLSKRPLCVLPLLYHAENLTDDVTWYIELISKILEFNYFCSLFNGRQ